MLTNNEKRLAEAGLEKIGQSIETINLLGLFFIDSPQQRREVRDSCSVTLDRLKDSYRKNQLSEENIYLIIDCPEEFVLSWVYQINVFGRVQNPFIKPERMV